MGWNEDCNAGRDAQRAPDDAKSAVDGVDHEVTMLARTVDSNRWAAENRAAELARTVRELAQQLAQAQRDIAALEHSRDLPRP
jgi:hypothetical protein